MLLHIHSQAHRGNFVYEDLLKLIEQGTVALLHAPAVVRDAPPNGDPSLLWTRWMLRLPSMNARQILEECLRIAAEQFANTSAADLPVAIEKEIARDLLRMQLQPVMMDNYRRYVVLKGRSDTYLQEDKCPGVSAVFLSDTFWLTDDLCGPDRGYYAFKAGLQGRFLRDADRPGEEVDVPLPY